MSEKIKITYGKPRGADVYGGKRWIAKAAGHSGEGLSVEVALYDLVEKMIASKETD